MTAAVAVDVAVDGAVDGAVDVVAPRRASGWLHSAPFDLVLAFGWIPFYAWVCTTAVVQSPASEGWRQGFELTALAALSVNFIHRHFVYFLFFGDPAQRQRHPRALWLAPVVTLAAVAVARLAGIRGLWTAVIVVLAAWNIWHVLLQRHGIARAYAAKAGGGLDAQAHGRRDLAVVFGLTLFTAAGVLMLRQDTFAGLAKKAAANLRFLTEHPERLTALLAGTGLIAAALLVLWLRAERAATPKTSRLPRLLLWLSTVLLLAVFWVHGPLVGYIVFGFAHSVEYILFVHMYSRRRMQRGPEPLAVRLLGMPVLLVIISVLLLGLFAAARTVWSVPLFVVYYSTTSLLHYFYDGIVWKMRRPEVRAPLVAV